MGNQGASFLKDLSTNLSRYILRKARRYNVVPRAEKQLEKMKKMPMRAPNYEATMKEVERLSKEMPQKFENLKEKDDQLYKNLEKVFVSSKGDNVNKFSKETVQPSLYRQMNEPQVFEEVPQGKFNIMRAQHFLSAHAKDPKLFNADVLSQVYKIDSKAMRNILKRVKLLDVALPSKVAKKPWLQRYAEDTMPKDLLKETEVQYHERKLIEAKDLFDEFHKLPPRDKTKEILSISDWSLMHILQGKLPTALEPMFQRKNKKEFAEPVCSTSTEKKETGINASETTKDGTNASETTEDVRFVMKDPEKVVRPEDYDFDVYKTVNKKKAGAHSNVESEQKEKVSDKG